MNRAFLWKTRFLSFFFFARFFCWKRKTFSTRILIILWWKSQKIENNRHSNWNNQDQRHAMRRIEGCCRGGSADGRVIRVSRSRFVRMDLWWGVSFHGDLGTEAGLFFRYFISGIKSETILYTVYEMFMLRLEKSSGKHQRIYYYYPGEPHVCIVWRIISWEHGIRNP